MNASTPIWQLTVGELMELIQRCHDANEKKKNSCTTTKV